MEKWAFVFEFLEKEFPTVEFMPTSDSPYPIADKSYSNGDYSSDGG